MEMFNPPHPGNLLLEGYMKPLNLTITEFALKLGMSRKCLSEIINGKAAISTKMALKIKKSLKSRASFWLDLQQEYDLWQARQNINLDNVEVIAL